MPSTPILYTCNPSNVLHLCYMRDTHTRTHLCYMRDRRVVYETVCIVCILSWISAKRGQERWGCQILKTSTRFRNTHIRNTHIRFSLYSYFSIPQTPFLPWDGRGRDDSSLRQSDRESQFLLYPEHAGHDNHLYECKGIQMALAPRHEPLRGMLQCVAVCCSMSVCG